MMIGTPVGASAVSLARGAAPGQATRVPAAVRILLLAVTALLLGGVRTAEAGEPSAPRPPHPEPRVIVNVLGVRGPHPRAEVERAARLGWGKIVSCYRASEPRERAVVTLELVVSGRGEVARARRIRARAKDRRLGTCLADVMQGLEMPKARARSVVTVEIRLAPGDPPAGEARASRD